MRFTKADVISYLMEESRNLYAKALNDRWICIWYRGRDEKRSTHLAESSTKYADKAAAIYSYIQALREED